MGIYHYGRPMKALAFAVPRTLQTSLCELFALVSEGVAKENETENVDFK